MCMEDMFKPWSFAVGASIIGIRTREGMEKVFVNGGTRVAHVQPEDTDVSIGRPIAFHPEITPPHRPTDCAQASRIPQGWASGDRLLSSHHQCSRTTHRITWVKCVGTYSWLQRKNSARAQK